MNRKGIKATSVLIAVLLIALVGVIALWGTQTLAITPIAPAVTYEGEFDSVKFITETDESFYSDYVSSAFREDTTLDLWTGNITMANFTKSGDDLRADLYFEIDGSNGMQSLDELDIELVSTTYTTKNITIESVELFNYRTGALIKDFSNYVADSELDTEYNIPLPTGKYVMHLVFHGLYLSGNVSPANVYKLTMSGESDGDVTDIEADVLIGLLVT